MRILLVSDLHYTLRQFDWVVDSAPRSIWWCSPVTSWTSVRGCTRCPDRSSSCTTSQLLQAAGQVAVSSGNHDLTGPDAHGERAALWLDEARSAGVPTDGDSLLIGDTLITICPWWDGPVGRERGCCAARARCRSAAGKWVWVYHWPPLGSPTCWTGRRHYGDGMLGGWIDEHRPDVVLTGHVHDPPFKPDGRGRTESATRGSSTPVDRSVRCRHASNWTSTPNERRGCRCSAPRRST